MCKHFKKCLSFCLAIAFSVLIAFNSMSIISIAEDVDTTTEMINTHLGNEQFNIDIEYGIDGLYKPERSAPIRFIVTNKGDDFQGSIHLVAKGDNEYGNSNDEVHFAREISIAKDETRVISMVMPNYSNSLSVEIYNSKEKQVYKKKFINNVLSTGMITENNIIGILSDDYAGISYFDGVNLQVLNAGAICKISTGQLDEETFPDISKALNSLCAIIIDNFDTSKLSEEQLSALKGYVNAGGVLIVSTGAEYNKVLSGLPDDLISGSVSGLSSKKVTFNYTKYDFMNVDNSNATTADVDEETSTVEVSPDQAVNISESSIEMDLDIANIKVDNANEINNLSKESGIASVKYLGDGAVIVTNFSLGRGGYAEHEDARVAIFEKLLYEALPANIAENVAFSTINSGAQELNTSDAITMNDNSKRPNVVVFYIVLIIYILLVGPIGYLILKKMDKVNKLWLIAPIMSIIFVGIMYIASLGQLVRHISVNYLAFDEISENARYETMYVSIAGPKKGKTTVNLLPELKDVSKCNTYSYSNSFLPGLVEDDAFAKKVILWEKPDHTMITVDSKQAFSSSELSMTRNVSADGDISCDISFDSDSVTLTGSLTNNTGHDLKDVVIAGSGNNYYFSEIKLGEKVNLDDAVKASDIWQIPDLVHVNNGVARTFGNSWSKEYRRLSNYINMLQTYSYSSGTDFEIFAVEKGATRSVTDDKKVDQYGMVVVHKTESVGYAGGDNLVSYNINLDFIDSVDGNLDTTTGSLTDSEAVVSYRFESAKINSLLNFGNADGIDNVARCFIFNNQSNQYEEIFADANSNFFSLTDDYIEDDGYNSKIKIRYVNPNVDGMDTYAPIIGGGNYNANN
ncbi:MAG: hypothetical protein K5656_10260 [Lachnospiraceae bacterium]|nr:hypothetical protein [Lachnospiraceae bacterium]